MQNPLSQLSPKIKLLTVSAVALFFLAIIASFIWYISTHGRVVVHGSDNNQMYVMKDGQTIDREGEFENNSTLEIGSYTIRVGDTAELRLARVNVKGWLQTTEVHLLPLTHYHVSRIASTSGTDLLKRDDAYTSYDQQDSGKRFTEFTVHPSVGAFGFNNKKTRASDLLLKTSTLGDDKVIGLTEGLHDPSQIVVYDPFEDKSSYLSHKTKLSSQSNIITSRQANDPSFVVSSEDHKEFIVYSNDRQVEIDLKQPTAKLNETPLVSVAGKTLAVVTGSDFQALDVDGHRNDSTQDSKQPTTVYIYDLETGKEKNSFEIPQTSSVSDIVLSTEGNVALLSRDNLYIYDKNGVLKFSNQYAITNTMSWRSGGELITTSVENGIGLVDVKKGQLTTIYNDTSLSFNNSRVTKEGIVFTAFSELDPGATKPDGYFMDLNKPIEQGQKIFNHLPITKNSYWVNVLNDTVEIMMFTAGDSSSSLVSEKLDEIKLKVKTELRDKIGDEADDYKFITKTL